MHGLRLRVRRHAYGDITASSEFPPLPFVDSGPFPLARGVAAVAPCVFLPSARHLPSHMPARRRLTSNQIARARELADKLKVPDGSVNSAVLIELAEIFAESAVHLESPAKSFAKRIPHHLGDVLDRGEMEAVIQAASERVALLRAGNDRFSTHELQRLLSIREAAPLLDLTVGVMEKLLIDWRFRRDCGWPQWLRGRWYFHPEVFGLRKPEYFSRLPLREPYPAPPHCVAQPTDETGS